MKKLIGTFTRIRDPKTKRIHFVGKLNGWPVELRQSQSALCGPDPDQFELSQEVTPCTGGPTIHEPQRHLLPGGSTLIVPAKAYFVRNAPALEPYFPELGIPTTPRKRSRKGGKP